MRIDIISVVPELLESPLSHSIVGRAISKGIVEIHVHNLRKFGKGPRLQVDDYSYGGDAGMVIMVEPVYRMIRELESERDYDEIIYMSPDGEQFDQNMANELSLKENIIILCGHYKGIDHRIREHLVTREITVGDYVLSGGELPAARADRPQHRLSVHDALLPPLPSAHRNDPDRVPAETAKCIFPKRVSVKKRLSRILRNQFPSSLRNVKRKCISAKRYNMVWLTCCYSS